MGRKAESESEIRPMLRSREKRLQPKDTDLGSAVVQDKRFEKSAFLESIQKHRRPPQLFKMNILFPLEFSNANGTLAVCSL